MATKLVIEPIFEADFLPHSHGFRPKRSAHGALEQVGIAGNEGRNWVVDADISAYFDNIDKGKLMAMVAERISDRKVLKLLRQWLDAGLFEDGTVREMLAGTAQLGQLLREGQPEPGVPRPRHLRLAAPHALDVAKRRAENTLPAEQMAPSAPP